MSFEAISNRTVSANNVSVGTALAMETILPHWPIFDPERPIPKGKLRDYKALYINLHTLIRNFYNAVDRESREGLHPQVCAQAILEEVQEIQRHVKDHTADMTKVVVYYPDYEDLEKLYPKGKLRLARTEKQKKADEHIKSILKACAKALKEQSKDLLEEHHTKIHPKIVGSILALTHYPVDLLSEYRFGKLTLLESHTGQIKAKNQWHSKLFSGKQFPFIPFNSMTLQVFGDDHHFHPWSPSIKNAITTIAKRNRWSWATTSAKIRLDLSQHPDKIFVKALTDLL